MSADELRIRAVFVLGLVLVAFAGLLGRLFVIQVQEHDLWTERATEQQWSHVEEIPAARGDVLDRRGRVLAHTVYLSTVAVDPQVVKDMEAVLRLLHEELGLDRDDLRAAVKRGGRRFAYLARNIRDRNGIERVRVRVKDLELRGIIVRDEPRRVYPGGILAAHVLGFCGRDMRGREGMERKLDDRLTGVPGERVTWRDGAARRIAVAGHPDRPPVRGSDVRLTLDAAIQSFAEEAAEAAFAEHGPLSTVAAVVDVTNGDLLAVACRPTFDPNHPGDADAEARRNRFFTDSYEPGSTLKPIVMSLALETGAVRPGDVFDCTGGTITLGRRSIREDAHHDYGKLTAAGVLAKSSNVGMVMVGLKLGARSLHAGLTGFGFGMRTAVGWPAEASGRLAPLRSWTEHYSVPSLSFGHEIAASPAQMLAAYATLASGGVAREMRLTRGDDPVPGRRVISARAAGQLLPMLEAVMAEGTGESVSLDEYRVAGKTGTPQKIVGRDVVGVIGSFACFGPAEAPRLAVIVACDEPEGKGYGSTVAAPYAIRLLRDSLRYLAVPESRPLPPSHTVALVPRPEIQGFLAGPLAPAIEETLPR